MRAAPYAFISTFHMSPTCQRTEAALTLGAQQRRQKVRSLLIRPWTPNSASRVQMNIRRRHRKNAIHMLFQESETMDHASVLILTQAMTANNVRRDSSRLMKSRMVMLNVYLMRNIWAKQFATHMDNQSQMVNSATSIRSNVIATSTMVANTATSAQIPNMHSPTAPKILAHSYTTPICNMLSYRGRNTMSTATQQWPSDTSQMTNWSHRSSMRSADGSTTLTASTGLSWCANLTQESFILQTCTS